MIKRVTSLFLLAGVLATSGCGLYRMPVQQGNHLSGEELARVVPGMTHTQVQDVLGTPLLTDDFRQNRWDYVFYLKEGNRVQRSGVTVFFSPAGVVTDVRRDNLG